jgi:hypothetical protein
MFDASAARVICLSLARVHCTLKRGDALRPCHHAHPHPHHLSRASSCVPAGFGCVLFDTELWFFLMSWSRQLGVSHQSGSHHHPFVVPPFIIPHQHTRQSALPSKRCRPPALPGLRAF